jgi:hypothetical protein
MGMILSILNLLLATIIGLLGDFATIGAAAENGGTIFANESALIADINRRIDWHAWGFDAIPKLEITFDPLLEEAFAQLEQDTRVNVDELAATFPDLSAHNRWLYAMFPDFFNNWREDWLKKADSYISKDGTKMALYRLGGVIIGMPVKCDIKAEPIENKDGQYDVVLYITFDNGDVFRFFTYTIYDTNTGQIGEVNGISGLGFNFNFKERYAFTTHSAFSRAFGYTKFYDDTLLKIGDWFNVGTVRLKFKYAEKDWMMQLWKGRYFTTTGGEVGLYVKNKARSIDLLDLYDSVTDEQTIPMSLRFWANDPIKGEVPLVDRPQLKTWWMSSFAVSENIYTPNKITLETYVTPVDAAMMQALVGALDGQIAAGEALEYQQTDDGRLYIKWLPTN